MDFSSNKPGVPWPQQLKHAIDHCRVVLVVIGRDWLKIQNPSSYQRRIDERNDWVRLEIKQALTTKKRVIPLLVRDAVMPTTGQLPKPIRGLAALQSVKIRSEDWDVDIKKLVETLVESDIHSIADAAESFTRSDPSMLGVLEYFYQRIGAAAAGKLSQEHKSKHTVSCDHMRHLWLLVEDRTSQDASIEDVPVVRVRGQLSLYAPLLFGHPKHKRQLHLELRQGAVELVKALGCEFGELLNGLLSYSAGQMVIRPYFMDQYVYIGLYESIVRNSIPVMIERKYFTSLLSSLFQDNNTLDVVVQGFLDEIPNYAKAALQDFGITDRLKSFIAEQTLQSVGQPNCALIVNGDEQSFVELPSDSKRAPRPARYLDGDVWVANGANSLITRFIDVSWREDMLNAVADIEHEVNISRFGRGIISSFDGKLAPIDETLPNRVLSAEQLERRETSQ